MFDSFRHSLNDLLGRRMPPDERRRVLAEMRESLVQAKVGLEDLRTALERVRGRIGQEERELETVRRRRQLAENIGDAETAGIASRFEQHHAERLGVLQAKLDVQQRELAMAEREVAEMTQVLKSAAAGAVPASGGTPATDASGAASTERPPSDGAPPADPLDPLDPAGPDLDALRRSRARADRDAEAERRLEELKRRMGK